MIKLVTLWAAWRVLRALTRILLVATIALMLLGGASRKAGNVNTAVGQLQHRAQPLEQQLQHKLQKAFEP